MILHVRHADGSDNFYQLDRINITPDSISGTYSDGGRLGPVFLRHSNKGTAFYFMYDTGKVLRDPVRW